MFTGIIEEKGVLQSVNNRDGGIELVISSGFTEELNVDQSISINGACHTVIKTGDNTFTVFSVGETMRKTTMGELNVGDPVNLERSMTADKLLDGHIVQGHVDAVGTIETVDRQESDRLYTISYPEHFADLIVGRGSISVEGISLTVADEDRDQNLFRVAIIPYTYEYTNFQSKEEGDRVNLEFDILGKYVVRYLEGRDSS